MILSRITRKNLIQEKGKTAITLVAVTISIAMITMILMIIVSYMNFLADQVRYSNGYWSVAVENPKEDFDKKIKGRKDLIFGSYQGLGFMPLRNPQNTQKPYIYLASMDSKMINMSRLTIIKGRHPAGEGEIVIPEHLRETQGTAFSVGKKIKLDIGSRKSFSSFDDLGQYNRYNPMEEYFVRSGKKTFKIVGICERLTVEPVLAPGYMVIASEKEKPYIRQITRFFSEKSYSKVKGEIKSQFIGSSNKVHYNDELLNITGVEGRSRAREILFFICLVLIGFVMVGSIVLLANAFTISSREKEEEFRIYFSIGVRPRQLLSIAGLEALFYGIVGIPLGMLAGSISSRLIVGIFDRQLTDFAGYIKGNSLILHSNPSIYFLVALLGFFMIEISMMLPLHRILNISIFGKEAAARNDVGRQEGSRIFKWTLSKIEKYLGIEGVIGYKNYRRNKRRYFMTVVSLSLVSIVFVSGSVFMDFLSEGVHNRIAKNSEYDVSLEVKSLYEGQRAYGSLADAEDVRDIRLISEGDVSEGIGRRRLINAKVIHLVVLDDASFERYAESNDIDSRFFFDSGNPLGIGLLESGFRGTEDIARPGFLGVAAYASSLPQGVDLTVPKDTVIISASASKGLYDSIREENFNSRILFAGSNDKIIYSSVRSLAIEQGISTDSLNNIEDARRGGNKFILVAGVFTYGFVLLITVMAIANVVNTAMMDFKARGRERSIYLNIGMTKESYIRILTCEGGMYALKAIIVSLAVSIPLVALIYNVMSRFFSLSYRFPLLNMVLAFIAVFSIVMITNAHVGRNLEKQEADVI